MERRKGIIWCPRLTDRIANVYLQRTPRGSTRPTAYRKSLTASAWPDTVRVVTTDDRGSTDEPKDDRETAQVLYHFVCQDRDKIDNYATADELAARTTGERLANAQLLALQAIYHELRYGHDQMARQTAAMEAHTKAMEDHAEAMDTLRGALLDHSDQISRFRRHER